MIAPARVSRGRGPLTVCTITRAKGPASIVHSQEKGEGEKGKRKLLCKFVARRNRQRKISENNGDLMRLHSCVGFFLFDEARSKLKIVSPAK